MSKYSITKITEEVLAYFKTKDTLQDYWKNHSRREINPFVQKTFGVSYFIFRKVVLEELKLADRTQEDSTRLNKLHREKTNLERYGRTNVGQFGTDEHKAAMVAKYGVDNYFKTNEIKQMVIERCKGIHLKEETKQKISNTVKSQAYQEQTRQTNLEKYGVEYTFQVDNFREKSKQTWFENYGMYHAPRKLYYHNNYYFDSLPELALYLYAKTNDEEITRLPCKFSYKVGGKTYNYYPDFRYKGKLIEIKGNQFLAEDGTWQNPYNHTLDYLMEAKRQCALQHNVEIWYQEDYLVYLEWFKNKGYKKENFICKEA